MEVVVRSAYTKDLVVVVTTIGVFALVCWLYLKYQPVIVLSNTDMLTTCPTRWIYRVESRECAPLYPTKCMPFNPDSYSPREKCDIAKSCGTSWKGLC
jgi:hypothetical protein